MSGEKDHHVELGRIKLDANSPISQRYLTFESDLPTLPADSHGRELPPPPNLGRLGSPLEWSPLRKHMLLFISCTATFLTAYSVGSYSPAAAVMAQDLGTSQSVVLVGVTTFCLGFALAPMALAPISEIWGRFPVLAAAGVVFIASQVACSVMPNATGLLIARFFAGAGASVFGAVVGGVITDLWDKEDRNTPLAIFSGSVLAGTGAGPLVATVLLQGIHDSSLAWKWTFWHQVIMDAVLVAAIFLLCTECRASVLLTQRARLLNNWYKELETRGTYGLWLPDSAKRAAPDSLLLRIRWLVKEDEQRPAVGKIIALSVRRPFYMLFTEPIVFCFSLWASFAWAILYLSFSAVPILYKTDLARSGPIYGAIIAAALVATITSILQQRLLQHPQWQAGLGHNDSKYWAFMRRRFPVESPEARLYFSCVTALLLPIGLFGAFFCSGGSAKAVGFGFATCGIYSVYLATFNYLADAYGAQASSALAAQSLCRNLLGGGFPLITGAMFTNLGLKGAGALLGSIAMVLTTIPWVLVCYGETIRGRSKLALSLQQ
ncbi:Major facilitator superfamily domain, general substrate transporter [Ophiocordyceps sinensis CO18]|uniref:Major facilitator superfamily domain, general substrate transporter n=1 Tax=Ophiocordyceps sinensis (strain Co18 / CGMCC 3.14243) TaxID=911162 RepID=T5A351_OPHSC|nr:Major facilitator superfamily domain, general substrate transporter [Ophiocordyceps sinensis CO18]